MNRKVKHNISVAIAYRAENTYFFPQMKTSRKATFVYIDFFTLLIMYRCAKQC